MRINLPNQITLGRLVLAIVFVALLSEFDAARRADLGWRLNLCFWIFLAAALMDILDGYVARRLHEVTSFGRILDPVVDKVMVLSAFLLFASHPFWDEVRHVNITGVAPWMVVVMLTRELLVSAVRTHVESEGREFGALWMGKLKMFLQSVAVCVVLGRLAWFPDRLAWLPALAVWTAVIATALSAVSYIHRARALLLSSSALGGPQVRRPEAPVLVGAGPAEEADSAARAARYSRGGPP